MVFSRISRSLPIQTMPRPLERPVPIARDDDRSLVFRGSRPFTLGVELEFQLIDPFSLDLVPRATRILERASAQSDGRIKQEFIESMVEVTTGICQDMEEVEADLRSVIERLQRYALACDCHLYASSLHPFARAFDQRLSTNERYHEIMEELQIVGRRMITQGLHVHVGLPDGDSAIKVFDQIRFYLPLLLALTASSPYFEGQDTGLCSYRSKLFDALPRAGLPGAMGTWKEYQGLAALLERAGIIETVRDIWWDVRPHPCLGTIEVRICDVPGRFSEVLGIAALIQSLVAAILDDGLPIYDARRAIILNNKWQAARFGLEADIVDPVSLERVSIRDAISHLVGDLEMYSHGLGCRGYIQEIHGLMDRGGSYNRQRRLYRERQGFQSVIQGLRSEFWR